MDKELKTQDGYYIWKKNENLWINNWFKTKEFQCKCSNKECVDQKISVDLIQRLTAIREYTKSPMRITSAFRCSRHQEAIRKSGVSTVVAKKSTHENGDAADISVSSLTIGSLLPIVEKQFKSIGVANNFLHVDLRDDKVRRWKY